MKKALFFVAICCFSLSVKAQFEVTEAGKIEIGGPPPLNLPVDQEDTVTMVRVYGTGYNGSGARLAFGDSRTRYAMNVMVGEVVGYGNGDTDQLWVLGKKGMYFTSGHASGDTIFFYDTNKGNYFKFNTNVIATSFAQPSDSRFKTNVNPLENALESVEALDAITYNLKSSSAQPTNRGVGLTEKEKADEEYFNRFYNERNAKEASKLRYGFIAQELEKVFPDLVETDENGMKYVDYVGLVPVLVEAVKELRAEIAELKGEDAHGPQKAKGIAGADDITASIAAPALYQNAPNPFTSETVIRYVLPQEVVNAAIYIFDLQGKQLKAVPVTDRGDAHVTIAAGNLPAGMYIYTLIADGKEIDSKRMILTK